MEPLDASVVTVFAPLNEAIEAAQSGMSDASAEQQTALLLNHVVNGSVIYSTSLASGAAAAIAGVLGSAFWLLA